MSRGPGRVQRFILAYLAEGHAAEVPTLGHSPREIARAMAGQQDPPRSAIVSVTRAMRELHDAGLAVVYYPHFRRRGANTFIRSADT